MIRGSISINVKAKRTERGHVECAVTCNGQRATVIFTGSEVITEVPEEAEGE